jgi:hypothetical protein
MRHHLHHRSSRGATAQPVRQEGEKSQRCRQYSNTSPSTVCCMLVGFFPYVPPSQTKHCQSDRERVEAPRQQTGEGFRFSKKKNPPCLTIPHSLATAGKGSNGSQREKHREEEEGARLPVYHVAKFHLQHLSTSRQVLSSRARPRRGATDLAEGR